jgi:hypothetical protein
MNGDNSNRELLIKVERLRNLLVSKATNKPASDKDYVAIRDQLLRLPPIAKALPTYVSSCHTLDEFWQEISQTDGYEPRRKRLKQDFLPILTALEQGTLLPTGTATVANLFARQFPIGLPFGLKKPDMVLKPSGGTQVMAFEDGPDLGVIRDGVYPDFTFAALKATVAGTPIARFKLEDKLVALIQTPRETAFFRHCVATWRMFTDKVPVLVPQAWIQWHSMVKPNLRAIGSSYADDLNRVDFVAFWRYRRFAILIDGIGHYGKQGMTCWEADEEAYSKRLKEDRKLRKEGWEVFRVSNWEIRNPSFLPEILGDLREFIRF